MLLQQYAQEKLAADEIYQVDADYAILRNLKGIGGKGTGDISSRINEILYGDNGGWRGSA
ncbi:MAG: hypothetical protein KC421_25305 [Anaerolineales bacterium]|nr:hypothetical protein [Anaerolineales bacterium]